jgi:hypothetical protein
MSGYYTITGQGDDGYDWVSDLAANSHIYNWWLGAPVFQNTQGDTPGDQVIAESVADPDAADNTVLHYQHNDASSGRLSAALVFRSGTGSSAFTQGYSRYRMRIENADYWTTIDNGMDWYVLQEWFGHYPGTSTQSARVSFTIIKDGWSAGSPLVWQLAAQNAGPWSDIWRRKNSGVPIPIGEWFTLETFIKAGDASTGRVWIAITRDGESRQVLFDESGYTYRSDDTAPAIDDWAFFKCYVAPDHAREAARAGRPYSHYYDDIEFWTNPPSYVSM